MYGGDHRPHLLSPQGEKGEPGHILSKDGAVIMGRAGKRGSKVIFFLEV